MDAKGVILAGGKGTRLGDLTRVTNKHLLPVAYQPMIFYPIKKLVNAGITEIMIISGTEHMGAFIELLGSGAEFGCSFTYRVQDTAGGIAQALGLASQFCQNSLSVVLLGDNIFYDPIDTLVEKAKKYSDKAWVVLKEVEDPCKFGVAEFYHGDLGEMRLSRIVEKPTKTDSPFAVTGVYVYPPDVYAIIPTLKASERGEFEITDINNRYLQSKRLEFTILRGYWTDAGTIETLTKATELVNEYGVRLS